VAAKAHLYGVEPVSSLEPPLDVEPDTPLAGVAGKTVGFCRVWGGVGSSSGVS
jgi:hypothetical protein